MHTGEFGVLVGVVRSRAGRTRVGMPEERVYFPAGILIVSFLAALVGSPVEGAWSDVAGANPSLYSSLLECFFLK